MKLFALFLLFSGSVWAQPVSAAAPNTPTQSEDLIAEVSAGVKQQSPHVLVEEFTAETLAEREWKLGTEVEFGITDQLMIGTDLIGMAVGVPSVQFKYHFWQRGRHLVAFGMRMAYFDKKTFLWGDTKKHWDALHGEVFRPAVSWTHVLSDRLKLHTFWAKGLGEINAELSNMGKRKLCETKYPNADCRKITDAPGTSADELPGADDDSDIGQDADSDGKADDVDTNKNLETGKRSSSPFSQSIPVQSITGFAQDRFQITGEINRNNGNKILVTARIEQTSLEDLEANFFRLTAAHQWVWSNFQMRLGIGTQYFVMTGRDLDGVEVDDSGAQPASDIGFYWRF